ncbi:MAG: fibro-slime domain-containing protein [Planctomycetota bacterium]|nr:fibro-slime domain-containing protein [Planctomycetota bacterium]MEC9157799.1 fibro-slime domain-containing protein [Planctomycetota bacterium]MED5507811.1 fibro-slime domain-containing protein [Planctomycetota bacterium]MED6307565.1 fibro-slime domain-containing protein [Planctomycetota bacterium]
MRPYWKTLICTATLGMTAGASTPDAGSPGGPEGGTEEQTLLVLTGVVRDFEERGAEGGHPDFERQPDSGFGQYAMNINQQLGEDNKPVFDGGGRKLRQQFENSNGEPICWTIYDEQRGDRMGLLGGRDSGGITSRESFDMWFNDVLGTNMSRTLELELERQPDGSFVFDSDESDWCREVGGFFPIENQLLGNSMPHGNAPDRNFHFTFELHTEFTYEESGAQVFTFRGDDDVWVFIDGRLVIDVGGVHGAIEQSIELDRLDLEDGEVYQLSFFFAERHRTESNFRIQTNLKLETVSLPTVTAAYD